MQWWGGEFCSFVAALEEFAKTVPEPDPVFWICTFAVKSMDAVAAISCCLAMWYRTINTLWILALHSKNHHSSRCAAVIVI